ncbi:biotin-dependent carboxyltransferase family protein [Pseudoalteromonas sp. MMG010]|uniref:5-oxoprolinase subunit C family protein n=1 Tax=Pseudoalteromonas sp. MMG010 TaxID=2822685 RepID=UPI001B3A781E|nr:biotin-dependent carboxyltransferase family protein [Pseudoalteromonas sp. MMG010]MBQ4832385.1 biotin-dependent carboxyltransferase family protein [Pseudoalteromonas sp. MMG010]
MIEIIKPGILLTVQDAGRNGYRHLGVSKAGCLDPIAQKVANKLIGNNENAAVLELSYGLAQIKFHAQTVIALTGADLGAKLDSSPIYHGWNYEINKGQTLTFASSKNGLTAYIAIQGGLCVQPVMGSAATDLTANFGGFKGRSLNAGDKLLINNTQHSEFIKMGAVLLNSRNHIRLHPSIHHKILGDELINQFIDSTYTMSEHSNRMGARLSTDVEGRLAHKHSLKSLAVAPGSIQLPPNGKPIILLNDCQTTGGYPLLGTVIAADIHYFAQIKPSDTISFEYVDLNQSKQALLEQRAYLAKLTYAINNKN